VPLGVIGIIYEARPNALSMRRAQNKKGNATILREAAHENAQRQPTTFLSR
jgi:gamma-glutamyl phosphate reductase